MAPSNAGAAVIKKAIDTARMLFERNDPREELGGIEGLFTILCVERELTLEIYAGVSDEVAELAKTGMAAWTKDNKPTESFGAFGVRQYVYVPKK